MIPLKYRKVVFSLLLALFAGGSLAMYSTSEMNFVLKTAELLMIQQFGAAIIYLVCFGQDLLKSSSDSGREFH
jgi:hypothetical protein